MAAKGSKGGKKLDVYKQCFNDVDKNGDGYIDASEMKAMLKGQDCHMTDDQIEESFQFFEGPGGDKRITFEEFCKGLDAIMAFLEDVLSLFYAMDTDENGYLDRNELKNLLHKLCEKGKKFTDAEIDQILKDADINGDNKISPDEFVAALC